MVMGEHRRFYFVKMGLEEAGGSLNANQRFQLRILTIADRDSN